MKYTPEYLDQCAAELKEEELLKQVHKKEKSKWRKIVTSHKNEQRRKEKFKKNNIILDNLIYNKYNCSSCDKPCLRTKSLNSLWINEKGNTVLGKRCIDCHLRYNESRKVPKIKLSNTCLMCNNLFESFNKNQKYCSSSCRPIFKRPTKYHSCLHCTTQLSGKQYVCNNCKNEPKVKIIKQIICIECKKQFNSLIIKKFCSLSCCKKRYRTENKEYIKQLNKNKYKGYKRLRKKNIKQAKPKWVSWKQIDTYYRNKPEGYHVDHIIPLKHPLVCGLHCKENFQYLSPVDNVKKSNSFDGTRNNNSWKKNTK